MTDPARIGIRRLPHGADLPLPKRATAGSAGFDLHAAVDGPVTLQPLERALIPTGIALELPAGFEAQVRPRSGLAVKHGLSMVNTPGTIDSDYRGEVKVCLICLGARAFTVERGERIAQLVIHRLPDVVLEETGELAATERGAGGFGSTGTKP